VKTAVLYLRVSTTSQVHTDYDPEGISIPAQRVACEHKAEQMGLTVVDEYVEPGRSATTIDKRPVFQQMLERIKHEHDVDYVIVYNLSRLNRNRVDDAKVLVLMRSLKVTLISAQENIDETPAGQLMHGILAAFNEYRSNSDGADIRYKMGQKAKKGGTVTRTKIGYLNVREMVDGHEIRAVAVDPERAPYVQLAFELAATGDYTMERLADVLNDRGLRMRPRANRSAGPISANYLGRMLRDRYYVGLINYDGEEYPGRHEPLVSAELFARVQAVLDERLPKAGERQRRHHHYLKGSLWCGRCHDKGVESRLLLTKVKGHGGEYWYFFCSARQEHACDAPYIRIEDAEAGVLRHYVSLRLPNGFADRVREVLTDTLADEERSIRQVHEHLTKRLTELEAKEENLLDLLEDGGAIAAKVRTRLMAIGEERERVKIELAGQGPLLEVGAALIRAALDLLDDPQELYRQTSDPVRRQLNQVFFDRLYLDTDEVTDDRLALPFSDFLYPRSLQRQRVVHTRVHKTSTPYGATWDAAGGISAGAILLERIARGEGSSKAAMVELRGLEPLTSSMPSTVGLCGGPALRLAIGHARSPLTTTMRADW
jgi:site-specific DNA recombinase